MYVKSVDYYEKSYYNELSRREEHRQRANIPFALFTTLGLAGLVFFTNSIPKINNNCYMIIFMLIMVIHILTLVYFIFEYLSFHSKSQLLVIPNAKEVYEYEKELISFYKDKFEKEKNEVEIENLIMMDLANFKIETYVDCQTQLSEQNKIFLDNYYKLYKPVKIMVVISVILLMLVAINSIG